MFYELTHGQGSDDETEENFNNAHLIEVLMTTNFKDWLYFRAEMRKINKKAKRK